MWAAADIYYLADRDPAVRYMWFRNIQAIPGALGEARRALAGPDPPALVVVENLPGGMDQTGATGRILRTRYRRVAAVAGVPIYAPPDCTESPRRGGLTSSSRRSSVSISIHSAAVWSSPPTGPEAVERGDAVVARPAAVGDAARVLLADLEAQIAGQRAGEVGQPCRSGIGGQVPRSSISPVTPS